ncbi:No apical meristem (NAM) protein [Corchorus olitorius]|uniref:No apical meristem (NAM) protein n=1 Tax=Corchorus olitorius TaxID=93759 RepID=A0A1R3HGQ4_9ROSI|nr:No apical meristem (NAM) protein [Corchorus olitorius]
MEQLEESGYHRFRPTDVELLDVFLKRKVVQGRNFATKSITELDIYKHAPWELPLRSEDFMWFFFCPVVMQKYGTGGRSSNRASEFGYWKPSGKDRAIKCMGKSLGVMKTLVFYRGKAPKGERTNWVVHEYRLDDEEYSYVICVVFQKDGIGPTRGFQYAAQSSASTCVSVLDADIPSPMSVASMDDKIVPESTGAPQVASQVQESSFDSSDSLVEYLEYIDEYLETASLNDGKEEEASHQLAMVQKSNHYVQSPPLQRDDGECFMYDGQGNDGELALVPQVQEANPCVQSPLQLFDGDHDTFMYDGQGNAPHQLTLLPQVQISTHNFPSPSESAFIHEGQGNYGYFPVYHGDDNSLLLPSYQSQNFWNNNVLYSNLLNQDVATSSIWQPGNFPVGDDNSLRLAWNQSQNFWNNNVLDSNLLNQDVTRSSISQPETQYGQDNYGGSSNFIQGNWPIAPSN